MPPEIAEQLKQTDNVIKALRVALFQVTNGSREKIRDLILKIERGNLEYEADLRDIVNLLTRSKQIYANFIGHAINDVFQGTFNLNRLKLEQGGLKKIAGLVDLKAVRLMAEHASGFFSRRIDRGIESVNTFFKFYSRQQVLGEGEISKLLAQGLIDAQDARFAHRVLEQMFESRAAKRPELAILDRDALRDFQKRKMAEVVARLKKRDDWPKEFKEMVLKMRRDQLMDGKLIQLVNRKGRIMTFRIETYAEIVTRTKVADAQVEGAIQSGLQYDVQTYRVSAHFTKSKVCQPHENQIYTLAKQGILARKFKNLNAERRPTYHPNCRHRLIAFPMTDEEVLAA